MKNLLLIYCLIFSLPAAAITFEITDLCEDQPIIMQEIPIYTQTNVLNFTAYHLKNFQVPHQITENGILSIFDTKTGHDAYEFINENHMRIYGWCFEVDQVESAQLASEFVLDPEHQNHLRWFYAYAEIKDGEWIHYCQPVHKTKQPFICPEF